MNADSFLFGLTVGIASCSFIFLHICSRHLQKESEHNDKIAKHLDNVGRLLNRLQSKSENMD